MFMKNALPDGAVETTLSILGDKWEFLIIRELLGGTKRFGEIKSGLKTVTQKVLTNKLRELEAKGIIRRKIYAQVPPKVEYRLTKTGETLKPVINAMTNWGNHYRAKKLGFEEPEELEVELLSETEILQEEETTTERKSKKQEMESFLL